MSTISSSTFAHTEPPPTVPALEPALISRGRKPVDRRVFRMREHDQGLGSMVFWNAPELDVDASYYEGLGPVVDIVLQKTTT